MNSIHTPVLLPELTPEEQETLRRLEEAEYQRRAAERGGKLFRTSRPLSESKPMPTSTTPPKLLSANALSRAANVPVGQIHAALREGKIAADFTSSHEILFSATRAPELARTLGGTPLACELSLIEDPAQRTLWFRKHEKALLAERAQTLAPNASVHTRDTLTALKTKYDTLKQSKSKQ